ncbi:MAG TPA: electron transfer flavoprotein subunit alpha/FixB family protein [Beutenbergiaceae bacterium]|nr:electron transfer flavoprotein subunit alpha/FixB family protein [Beutenbergiaceae bacterium]
MTTTLVLIDDPDQLRSPVAEALTVARGLGDPVALCLGAPSAQVLTDLGNYGVSQVLSAELTTQQRHSSGAAGQVLATAIAQLQPLAALLTSSFSNKEVAARAAWASGSGLLIDVSTLEVAEGRVVGGKRAFAGTWESTCAVHTDTAVLTLGPNAVLAEPAAEAAGAQVESIAVDLTGVPSVNVTSREVRAAQVDALGGDRPALAEAAVVVAGGRGTMGDFTPVEELADELGAAIGTTRDCVDEGWMGHDAQIGQTGVTIAPRLYIGAGISGAPHHYGGMQAADTVIAVNLDADAPLAEVADVVVVGDLHEILPAAAEALRAHREQH